MNVEEYCIENNKQELFNNFMLDIDPAPWKNMGGAESAMHTQYNNKKLLFNYKCHICTTEWEGSVYSYIVEQLCCPKCNANSDPIKIKYASRGKGQITLDEYCDDHDEDGQRIRAEFDDENNELTREEAFRLPYGSHTELNWKCLAYGHQWSSKVNIRTSQLEGCPYCASKKVSEQNSLYTWCLNNEKGKKIQSEWTGISESGKHYTMDKVTYGSSLKMLWHCYECGHEWYAMICDRTRGHDCPECAKKIMPIKVREAKTTIENSLSTYCLNNHLQGEIITNQWTGISESGEHYTMDKVAYGSTLKMLWRDKYNHEWYARVVDRAINQSNCPYCNTKSTSYPEQFIYWSFNQLYPDAENRYITFQSEQNPKGVEYDVAVLQLPLYIEYSPTYWHRDKVERDNYKKQLCEQHNIRFIQIIEDNYNEYEKKFTENYICIPELTASNKDDYLIKIVDYILNSINHNINEIDIETVKNNALKYSTGSIEYEKSVEFLFPTLAAEWHESNIIKPSEVTPGSASRIKFLCPNCSYKWEVDIHNRVNHQSGCPRCGYNWYKAHTGQPQKIKPQYRKFQEQKFDINTLTSSKSKPEWTEEEDLDI